MQQLSCQPASRKRMVQSSLLRVNVQDNAMHVMGRLACVRVGTPFAGQAPGFSVQACLQLAEGLAGMSSSRGQASACSSCPASL